MKNKKIIYQVYVGPKNALYDFCTESVKEYAKRIGVDYFCQKDMILCIKPDPKTTNRSPDSIKLGGLPIFEKMNAMSYLKKYDQVSIIDADVWIRDSADDIFEQVEPMYHFGGVIERSIPFTEQHRRKLWNYSQMQYGNMRQLDWKWNNAGAEFFNMGVMVLNKSFEKDYLKGKTPLQFLRNPRLKPFVDGVGGFKWSTDQTLLNVDFLEEKLITKKLHWRFNCLYGAVDKKHLKDAHFVHFFLSDKLPNKGAGVENIVNKFD